MGLTDEQKAQLEELEKLRDTPDEPAEPKGAGRILNIALDLGDPEQLERAFSLGILERPAVDDGDDGDDGGDDAADGPKRRGFFPEK